MKLRTFPIAANDYKNAGTVSSELKKWCKRQNYDPVFIRRFSIACYEAEINTIIHSKGGVAILDLDDHFINIIFQDFGPGIENIELAMQAGYSSASEMAQSMGFGAGLGLPNIQKNVDVFKLESCCEGTRLTIGFKREEAVHEN